MPTLDNPDNSLIVASRRDLPTFEMNVWAREEKQKALESAALIGKVTDRDSKIIAVRAQQHLKKVIADIEKARKQLKEPLLAAGRQLDNLCATETLELEKEFGRVSFCVREFDDAERRRVAEEERLQRLELERIEAQKQAELKRIADELAAKEAEAKRIADELAAKEAEAKRIQEETARKAAESIQAAAALAAAAKNKEQREAAEKARQEALQAEREAEAQRQKQEAELAKQTAQVAKQTAELAKQSNELAAKVEAIEEKAGEAAYCAAKPIEITTVKGQRQTSNWQITVENPYMLAKFHPDLVEIKPRIADIKCALNEGREIKGIKAVKVFTSDVRVTQDMKAIDV